MLSLKDWALLNTFPGSSPFLEGTLLADGVHDQALCSWYQGGHRDRGPTSAPAGCTPVREVGRAEDLLSSFLKTSLRTLVHLSPSGHSPDSLHSRQLLSQPSWKHAGWNLLVPCAPCSQRSEVLVGWDWTAAAEGAVAGGGAGGGCGGFFRPKALIPLQTNGPERKGAKDGEGTVGKK